VISAKVASLPDGTMGFDVTTPLNLISAKQFVNKGYGFVVRYVGRGDGSKTFVDLTQEEGQAIVDSGLGLCVVQHPLAEGWSPTAALGQRFGAAAATIAGGAGLPVGVTVWLDLEGVAPATHAQDIIDYCNEWYDEVSAVGFIPGVYVGANPGLSADQIYWDLSMKSYWRGGSNVESGVPADIPNRGYQMTQRITGSSSNEFDTDVTRTDSFGGKVLWCVSV
jgi:Domain of unknown function (DUF1906)